MRWPGQACCAAPICLPCTTCHMHHFCRRHARLQCISVSSEILFLTAPHAAFARHFAGFCDQVYTSRCAGCGAERRSPSSAAGCVPHWTAQMLQRGLLGARRNDARTQRLLDHCWSVPGGSQHVQWYHEGTAAHAKTRVKRDRQTMFQSGFIESVIVCYAHKGRQR